MKVRDLQIELRNLNDDLEIFVELEYENPAKKAFGFPESVTVIRHGCPEPQDDYYRLIFKD
jgi:hypothetical protein